MFNDCIPQRQLDGLQHDQTLSAKVWLPKPHFSSLGKNSLESKHETFKEYCHVITILVTVSLHD